MGTVGLGAENMLHLCQAAAVLVLGLAITSRVGGEDAGGYSETVTVASQKSSYSASSSYSSSSSSSDSTNKEAEDRLHPAHDDYAACKYTGEWGDCDPFKMIRIKEERLISGSATCADSKNITKPCSREDFPPGTVWLISEHKMCVLELQKLKTMIDDLHRYIDLIHQRGQSLFNAYNELRKRLMDVRRELSIIGRRNHDAEQTIKRLRVEMEDWKTKSNKMQMELNELQAQYKEMENKVKVSKETHQTLLRTKEDLTLKQQRLTAKLDQLTLDNRNLKSSLLDAERYKEEFREISEIIELLKKNMRDVQIEIEKTKEVLQRERLEGAMPKAKYHPPKYNKDTKVNLDMSMWITHNISKEESEPYEPKVKYYEETTYKAYEPPATYKPATYAPYEPPKKYEPPAYKPEPKYEEPKYEAPKYEEPKYEAPKYEAPKYEEPKYEEPKSEEPESSEEPKYEAPKYEEPEEEHNEPY